jgi:hypothetical protein
VTGREQWADLDAKPVRRRRKLCPYDSTELEQRAGFVYCPACGKTVEEMAQAVTR